MSYFRKETDSDEKTPKVSFMILRFRMYFEIIKCSIERYWNDNRIEGKDNPLWKESNPVSPADRVDVLSLY